MLTRLLPNGWGDLLHQILLFCGAYWLYRLVRGFTQGQAAEAFANARELVSIERSLGLFFEPAVNRWVENTDWLADASSWTYLNSHFVVTSVALAFLYLGLNGHYYFIRNMFMAAMGIALVLYALYPTAPPRMMPEYGFIDSVQEFTRAGDKVDVLYNPYAAVPSMHVAFALMIGLPFAVLARNILLRAFWITYPAIVSFVVVATANHWWLDGLIGAIVAATSTLVAISLAYARPDLWGWPRQAIGTA